MSEEPAVAPLRVAAVGLGAWGARVAARLAELPEFQLRAVCDEAPERLSGAGLGPETARLSELAEVLADPTLEAVFVALPPRLHAEVGLRVLEAGRHLFVEKPMALSGRDARRLERAAHERGLRVGVGHVMRHHPATLACERLVREGALGPIERVFVDRVGARPRPGVSPWWVLGPHDLSLLGAWCPGPISIRAAAHEPSGETRVHLALGAQGEARLFVAPTGPARRLTVWCGARGTLWLDEASATVRRSAARGTRAEPESAAELVALSRDEPSEERAYPGDALSEELRAFQRAVRTGGPLSTDAADGARVVELLEAVDRVAVNRTPLAR